MDDVLRFMRNTYARTKWPFFCKVDLVRRGATDKMLWEMKRKNLIAARDGIRGRIVELIIEE